MWLQTHLASLQPKQREKEVNTAPFRCTEEFIKTPFICGDQGAAERERACVLCVC